MSVRPVRALAVLVALAAPAAAGEAVWVVTQGGRELGRERVAPAESAEGGRRAWSSVAELDVTGQPWRYEQRLEVDAEGGLVAYSLDSEIIRLEAAPTEAGAEIRGTVAGNRVEREVAHDGLIVCLDNLVFSHYDALTRALVGAEAPVELMAVVPQAALGIRGRFTPGGEDAARTVRLADGTERAAREGRVAVGSLEVAVLYDAESGAAYRVEVPAQQLVAALEGVEVDPAEPAASGPPAEGVRELEVSFASPWGEIPGTLALPTTGAAPFPVVLFLPGSGPQDRDETIGPNAPLRDLAHGLAARRVASLRFDKRAHLQGERIRAAEDRAERRRLVEEATSGQSLATEYVEDARAALEWLAGRDEVRADATFLLGHSLGAPAAVRVAAAAERPLQGLVLLAAPGRPFDVLVEEQSIFQGVTNGLSREAAAERVAPLVAKLRRARDGALDPEEKVLGQGGAYWNDVCSLDPVAELAASALPVLLLQGGKDCQVSAEADFEALREALAGREGPPHEAHLYPGLNHLFMPVEGESTGAEYYRPGAVAPAVPERVAAWVGATLKD